jgi:hypothetical protein
MIEIEKLKRKSIRAISREIRLWMTDFKNSGEPLLQFSDQFAAGLFMSSMQHISWGMFRLGRKYEGRKRKRSAIRRYKKRGVTR